MVNQTDAGALKVGLDLRYVAGSRRGYRRMMELVYELDALECGPCLQLFTEPTPLITGHRWSPRTQQRRPSRYLRMMYRPQLGRLRSLLPNQPDVMHFLTADCWSCRSCPTVVTLHDLAPLEYPQFFFDNSAGEQAYHRHLERIAATADCVVTVSEYSREVISRELPELRERLETIYQGVDPGFGPEGWSDGEAARFGFNLGAPDGYLLYCGGVDARKNLEFLLRAYALYAKDGREVLPLVLVGDVDKQARGMKPLREIIRELGLQRGVISLRYVSDNLLRRLYNAAQLLVFPSLVEGFGYAPLEAMRCGCPVLCSPSGALRETVGAAAELAAPNNAEEWAEKIRELLLDQSKRDKLIKAGLHRAAEFNWADTAQGFWRVYQAVSSS